jgi:hypothetical protein
MKRLKKQPSNYLDEELLNILLDDTEPSAASEVVTAPNESSVIQFLADFGIYPGRLKVNSTLLRNLYYKTTENPVSDIEFHMLMQGYLRWEQNNKYRYYFVNRTALEFTKQLADFLAKKRKPKKVNSRFFRAHIEKFIAENKLKPGTKNIPMSALYYLYDKWQYKKTKTRLSYHNFSAIIKLYFTTKKTKNIWCVVKIDKEFFEQNKKEAEIAIEWAKKFNTRNAKKEIILRKDLRPKETNKKIPQ